MEPPPSPAAWLACVKAAEDKKATEIKVLDIRPVATYADFLILCNGSNARQIQSIADEVMRVMKDRNDPAIGLEGYEIGEWILIDFGDMVVHVFSDTSRSYYDFDRLYRDATTVEIPATV